MKKIILYISLLSNFLVLAQTTYKGKVVDKNNIPIEFAEAVLLKNQQLINGAVTNDKGEFSISAKDGIYTLKIILLGYENWEKKVNLKDTSKTELIQLVESLQTLDEVNIKSSKKTFKREADRLIFDIKNSLIGKSNGNITELLNFTPSVIIEEENIQVLGKDGVLVLINGRDSKLQGPSLMSFLKSMKDSDIDRIEIIKTPPAKYDAEGNIALINIITRKKNIDFWNSNISSSYRQGFYGLFSTTGSFNYNKNNLFFSTNISYTNGKRKGEERNKIFYPDNLWNQSTDYIYNTDLLTTNISSEYKVNSHWLIGTQYTGSFNTPTSSNQSNITVDQSSTNSIALINNFGNEQGKRKLNGINFHSVINITPSRVINVDFDYFDYKRDQNSSIESNQSSGNTLPNITDIKNSSSQNVSNFSSKIDVEYPIKNVALNFGGKVSFSKTNNDVLITGVVDFNQQTRFIYKEDVQALYGSLSSSFGLSKWSFKSGLRMERTETLAIEKTLNSEVKNDYLNFFPTIYINYKPNQHHDFSLDYSRRINRPIFRALNPFRIYTSPFSFSEGNPNLIPTISSSLSFSHLYKDALYSEIYFNQVSNNSGQVAILDTDNLTQSITRLNYFDNYNVGIWLNYLYDKKKWWQSSNTLELYYNKSTSKIAPITPKSIEGIGAILKTTNHFVIDKKQKSLVGFDFTYRFPNTSNELIYNFEQYFLNAFIKYSPTNDLQVSLTANNILREFSFNNQSTRNQTEAIYNGYYDTQYLKFSVNYNFGNKKVKKTNRNMSNTKERNRTN